MNLSNSKHFQKRHVIICLLLTLLLLTGCSLPFLTPGNSIPSTESISNTETSEEFAACLNEIFRSEVTSSTLNLHYTLKDPSSYGITDYPITFGHITSASDNAKTLKKTLKKIQTFSRDQLPLKQQFTYDLLTDYLTLQQKLCQYQNYEEPLIPSNGIQAELPVLLVEYAFHTPGDVEDYLELLSQTDDYFEELLDFEKEKADAGLFMSDANCNKVISECEEFISDSKNHYLITTFSDKIAAVDGLSEKEIRHYEKTNAKIVENSVFPAYRSLIDGLAELMGSGNNDWGVCYYPDGKSYYELLVYSDTGDHDDMETIQRKIEKQRTDDIRACADLIQENPDILQKCSAQTLSQTDPVQILESLKQSMQNDFPMPPDAGYDVHYVDQSLQDYLAPAFYITAPIDDYSNNSIYINNAKGNSGISAFTTLAHEGYPGHLYQTIMSYSSGMEPVRSLLNYPGYVEGWATYVEMMSYRYAGLDMNTADLLMHNQSATLSLYASSDIGIHYDGWTASDMYKFWEAYGITDHDAIDEITGLIVSDPGNYLKYYVGYLNFLALREKIQSSYGDSCSLTDFHKTLLTMGPAPFSLLDSYFGSYFKSAW